MKKVLFVIESLGGGGAEKVLTTIVKYLDKRKFDVNVLLMTETGLYLEEMRKYCNVQSLLPDYNKLNNPIDKIKYKLKYKFIYRAKTEKVYEKYVKEKYDIEIAFIEGFATKFVGASSNLKSKKLAWVHTDMLQNEDADICYKNKKQHMGIYKKFDRIVCVSDSVKQAFENKFSEHQRISVQYNPVDEKEIITKSEYKADVVYPFQGILLGTIGRLVPAKGYLRLAKCAKKLADKGYKFTIWIIGQGPEKQELEYYIAENNLEKILVLLGFKSNPYQYIKYCDAFICSSYAEGFSTAATESIILGKPVFTVECAGMKELFLDSKCGEVVPNTDEDLYIMLEKLVQGKYNITKYQMAAKERSRKLNLKTRINEIEELLSI